MAIVFASSYGWLLDTCSFIDEGFRECVGCRVATHKRYFTCRFKSHFFDISKPHIVDKSQSYNVSSCGLSDKTSPSKSENDTTVVPKARKKRKRKYCDLNQGELDAQAYHERVRSLVLEGHRSLVEAGYKTGYFSDKPSVPGQPLPSLHECRLAALCDMAKELPPVEDDTHDITQVVDGDPLTDAQLDLFSRITENPDDYAREVTLMGEKYFLPPCSRFLLADITRTQPLISNGERFDLIVLDPPWENKSVKRSNRYSFLPSSQLKLLPVPMLSRPGCVVVTWVTNRLRHLRFVKEELYPHWGVKLLAEWLWVKVTKAGDFVFPLDSPHKKPYEVLLIGRYHGNEDINSPAEESEIPDQKLLISIPSILHSHKPSLAAVMKPYVSHDAKCLEMFARSLQPRWTSWGNEVIKFQHVSYFSTENREESPSAPVLSESQKTSEQ
ncbi:methyltransferase-like protein 4 [Chanos chanos]|uniref:Methyltransferase-like protein 4 n=1 Tax=Chanos chanos TaxID=29144 RepID=A0A6J2VX44_CHACN|nr:methyltransferase-like protein 4 [Chanos chanos]